MLSGWVLASFSSFVVAQDGLAALDKIKLLVSTRNAVEKLFGPPVNPRLDLYDFADFRISVDYSQGKCREAGSLGLYDVPKDTVWKLLVSPKKKLPLVAFMARHPENFERGKDPELPNVFHYVNKDASIGIQTRIVDGAEDVDFFTYSPGRNSTKLRCRTKKAGGSGFYKLRE